MRRFLPVFMGLALLLGSTAVSRADDKEKTTVKTEPNGDVKIKDKTHKHKTKTKIKSHGDTTTVKTTEH